MEQIQEWLKRFGLNETEIAVYVAITKNPHCKTADIQRYTGLVRTTIYYSLAELKTHGLISENYQNNIKTYVANEPSVLVSTIANAINEQNSMLDDLRKLKPFFPAINNDDSGASNVSRYEGESAIKQAIDIALRCSSKRWFVLASHANFLSHTTRKYKDYYLSERRRRGIISKTLWEPHPGIKAPGVGDIVFRNPRVLPDTFSGNFDSLVIVYDDTVLFVQPYTHMTAHAINDVSTANVMRLLFQSLWSQAPKVPAAPPRRTRLA